MKIEKKQIENEIHYTLLVNDKKVAMAIISVWNKKDFKKEYIKEYEVDYKDQSIQINKLNNLLKEFNDEIKVLDLITLMIKVKSKGYGSYLLEQISKEHKINFLNATVSRFSKQRQEKLEQFYLKRDFQILFKEKTNTVMFKI